MFTRGISILMGSAVDPGNIPVPRPGDSLSDSLAQAALRALQAEAEYLPPSARLRDPDRSARIQQNRRSQLESFLWIEPNAAALERMVDLIGMILEEGCWADTGEVFDEPGHPAIDLQAAETGVLLSWMLRRHGGALREVSPRLPGAVLGEVRRRLLAPVAAQNDYPFMQGKGSCPALILSDLLLCCLLMERTPSRRQQPVKVLLNLLNRINLTPPSSSAPLQERLADACALTDLVRLLKRLTRGEFDLTRSVPSGARLDDLLIPWVCGEYFLDPGGEGMHPSVAGMDYFRLGYLTRDKALCSLGAQLLRHRDLPCLSLTGRILSMEYRRAAQDELSAPPRLKRAASEDGAVMLSRMEGIFAAVSGCGSRGNAGDIALFFNSTPILVDGGDIHSLPVIDSHAPMQLPQAPLVCEADFGNDRDLMSVDLTDAYPECCGVSACQRTLMLMRNEGSVRLVDAFEFIQPPEEIVFRFVCGQRPVPLRTEVRIGPMSLTWDGDLTADVQELPGLPFPGGGYLLRLTLRNPQRRLLCGFLFEQN